MRRPKISKPDSSNHSLSPATAGPIMRRCSSSSAETSLPTFTRLFPTPGLTRLITVPAIQRHCWWQPATPTPMTEAPPDARHVLNAGSGYSLRGWNLSSTLFARAGFPFDVTTVDRSLGFGFKNKGRANLLSGEPIWITNSAATGGRELNPAAFQGNVVEVSL